MQSGPTPSEQHMHRRHDLAADATNLVRGICMGGADIVPGVSGGTVALIFGIYERLVTAISHFDRHLLREVRQRRWRQAAEHVDLRFLLSLAAGIFCGFLMMTLLINRLLTDEVTRSMTLAAFFGMILASGILVALLVQAKSPSQLAVASVLGLLGAVFAYWLTTLTWSDPHAPADPSFLFLFVCGAVAICAMILPGISGAMILLILGVYVHLTEIPRTLLAGQEIVKSLLTIFVFGSGCALGLLSFSKVLRWLLTRFQSPTMAVLCGFMLGALPKIWPFQRDLSPEIEKFKYKQFEPVLPDAWDGSLVRVAVVALAAMLLVFAVEWLTRRGGLSRHEGAALPHGAERGAK